MSPLHFRPNKHKNMRQWTSHLSLHLLRDRVFLCVNFLTIFLLYIMVYYSNPIMDVVMYRNLHIEAPVIMLNNNNLSVS